MQLNWKDEGFLEPPRALLSQGGERLYRAWGGRSRPLGAPNRPGVCFSRDRAHTRAEAELFYSIAE